MSARVMGKTHDGLYELATRNGKLAQLYARSQFTVCKETFVEVEDVPGEAITAFSSYERVGGYWRTRPGVCPMQIQYEVQK